jgi:hypothetical protein
MWLWGSGSILYLVIALILILRGVQPLPYLHMEPLQMALYYMSYPFRVLGIFFIGLTFSQITSPAEFLRWGETGLKIALVYRAFEYSINSFEENRRALLIEGTWPEFLKGNRNYKMVFSIIRSAPVLVATTFRNIILWYPWAWICYNSLKLDIKKRGTT